MSRILVVEDQPVLRQNMVDRLRAEGHELFDTATGESALELATLLAPDLILADLRLPGIDGVELLRRVQRVGRRTSVIILTAYATPQAAQDALREGACDFLCKPIELRELVRLVDLALQRAGRGTTRLPAEAKSGTPDIAPARRGRVEFEIGPEGPSLAEIHRLIAIAALTAADGDAERAARLLRTTPAQLEQFLTPMA